jgi:formylglycine-generating enzyme required for sulfatase activity
MVVTLINRMFVPVRFALWLSGDGTDDTGREILGPSRYLSPPGVAAFDPEDNLVGAIWHTASAGEVLEFLKKMLAQRKDLAAGWSPDEELSPYDLSDPEQARLLQIERQIRGASMDQRRAIEKELERWLARHTGALSDAAALAAVLLGDVRFFQGDFRGANAAWQQMVERYPEHPLSHRARHNLLDKRTYPNAWHPSLEGAPRPTAADFDPLTVPFPEVRRANLDLVARDPRYHMLLDGLPFVKIPAGTFTMGGSPARFAREVPLRRVTISKPFYISAWPVTRAVWLRYRPDAWTGADREGLALELPAGAVSHQEAVEFAASLTRQHGRRFRLPTEAEWEYAGRGGLEGKQYPWGDEPIDETRANTRRPQLAPVASYPPNGYGLFDVVGNTAEWVADAFLADAYARTPFECTDPLVTDESTVDPLLPANSSRSVIRVIRASFSGDPFMREQARVSWRNGIDEWVQANALSFRLVVETDE